MTSEGLNGIEAHIDELAAMAIKGLARSQVASVVADEVLEKYREPFIKDVANSITVEEVRQRVIDKIVEEIARDWARERGQL